MADPLENLAKRVEDDSFFLACPLRAAANSNKLDDLQLAGKLRCPQETLVPLRLCRAPAGDAAHFQKDIALIAARFDVDTDALTELVRLGQALITMRSGPAARTLRAARDADEAPKDDQGGEA